jgi:rRNA maturation endonuclease Nob1
VVGPRSILPAVGQLKVNAINARLETGLRGFLFSMIRGARWELTCGFCKERFSRVQPIFWSSAVCPYCGTRNLLPVPRFPSDRGPRPPNWPDYRPPSN